MGCLIHESTSNNERLAILYIVDTLNWYHQIHNGCVHCQECIVSSSCAPDKVNEHSCVYTWRFVQVYTLATRMSNHVNQ